MKVNFLGEWSPLPLAVFFHPSVNRNPRQKGQVQPLVLKKANKDNDGKMTHIQAQVKGLYS